MFLATFDQVLIRGVFKKNRGEGGNRGGKSGGILGGIPSPQAKPAVETEFGTAKNLTIDAELPTRTTLK